MGLWQTNLIAIGLSLDVFAYCLYKGAMISKIDKRALVKMILIFTGFQAGMLLIGNAITWIPAIHESYQSANLIWTFFAALIFFGLGTLMIVKSFTKRHRKICEQKEDSYNYHVIAIWALITSLDALIAGIGFSFLGLQLIGAVIVVAIITAASVVVGLFCGYLLGCGPMNKLVTVGGLLVLIGGADILANYLIAAR